MKKPNLITFLKSQGASLAATAVEYCTILIWTEFFHQFYAYGVAMGAFTAALTNFLINRYWSFQASSVPIQKQGLRYAVVSAGSLCLNTGLVYLITENVHVHYMISVVFVGLLIGFVYNYPLQRFYVYKKPGDKSFRKVLKEVKTFSKATVAALVATVVDFGTLSIWVEILHQFYPIGVALGALFGAATNFFLNRHWAFDAARPPVGGQAIKYAMVSAGSLLLNTGGVYFITETFQVHYMISKTGVALLVALFFNYPLQRFFVYREPVAVGL